LAERSFREEFEMNSNDLFMALRGGIDKREEIERRFSFEKNISLRNNFPTKIKEI